MGTPEKSEWTAKDGWNYLKKIITQPEKSMAIREGLNKLNSHLTLIDDFVVSDNNRHSQIFSGFEDGSLHVDFWENGICWHTQSLLDIRNVTLAVYLWNDLRINSTEIEKEITGIKFPEARKKIEISNQEYIKWHWQNLVDKVEHKSAIEIELIKLLNQNEKVNKLMTFRQLWDLGLSRYIGEYGDGLRNDLLRATIKDEFIEIKTEEQAIMHNRQGTKGFLGQGNPGTAYKFIVDNLPTDIDWAEYQTLEQFRARIQKTEEEKENEEQSK